MDETFQIHNIEQRSIQTNGASETSLLTNLTEFGSRYHGFDGDDDVAVATIDQGILIMPLEEVDDE